MTVFNPYLPLNEYVPDGEPHLFEGRVYIYGSHDKAGGTGYCEDHYVAWSAPENDLSDWQYEGVIYRRNQDPMNADDSLQLYAPDVVCGADGRYYLYYTFNNCKAIGVAVANKPNGPFDFYGHVKFPDGTVWEKPTPFDPAVLNDDGKFYIYSGFTPSGEKKDIFPPEIKCDEWSVVAGLAEDMVTTLEMPHNLIPSEEQAGGTSFEGHGFFEASSIRKYDGRYYFVYSSHKSHELCYAISDYPDRDFVFGGTLVSNADVGLNGNETHVAPAGNNHGGLLRANGEYYIFYHRQTHGTEYSRQGCAEKLVMRKDGGFDQVEVTSCGLNNGPLPASGAYPAAIACTIQCPKYPNAIAYDNPVMAETTMVTEQKNQVFVANISDGTVLGYKYFAFLGADMLIVEMKGLYDGAILVATDPKGENVIGEADLHIQSEDFGCELIPLADVSGTQALYFLFEGKGMLDMRSFAFLNM